MMKFKEVVNKFIEFSGLSNVFYYIWWHLAKRFPERFGTGAQRNEAQRKARY